MTQPSPVPTLIHHHHHATTTTAVAAAADLQQMWILSFVVSHTHTPHERTMSNDCVYSKINSSHNHLVGLIPGEGFWIGL